MEIKEAERIFNHTDEILSVAVTRRTETSPYEWTTINLANLQSTLARYKQRDTSSQSLIFSRIGSLIRNLEGSDRVLLRHDTDRLGF